MLTILSRISSDIIHYVRANELFLLSMFLRAQGENKIIKIPFFGDFMRKWYIKQSTYSLYPPPPPRPTPISTEIFGFKWRKELNWGRILIWCLFRTRTEDSAFLHGFCYLKRNDVLLPLAERAQIKALCGWPARVPEQNPPPSYPKKTGWR